MNFYYYVEEDKVSRTWSVKCGERILYTTYDRSKAMLWARRQGFLIHYVK